MALAMGEDLSEFQSEDTDKITDKLEEMRKTFKRIVKLCKSKHRNFHEISECIVKNKDKNDIPRKFWKLD